GDKDSSASRASSGALTPPWPRFAQLVRQCLLQAGEVAGVCGRPPQEFFEQVYAQERYAERAYQERDQKLYGECFSNLSQFAGYLGQLKRDHLSGVAAAPAGATTEETVFAEVDALRRTLARLRDKVRFAGRNDLEQRVLQLERRVNALSGHAGDDAGGCF